MYLLFPVHRYVSYQCGSRVKFSQRTYYCRRTNIVHIPDHHQNMDIKDEAMDD